MLVHHLSHIDLDGYSCQFITSKIYKNIYYYNSNYGQEIDQKIAQILNRVKLFMSQKQTILITDLNLTKEQSKLLDNEVSKLNNVELILLDHHKSGEESANLYKWYHLDTTKCATKITYEYFKNLSSIDELKEFVEVVNAYDIWLVDENKNFEIGKVCAKYVSSAREINRVMFVQESFEYILSLISSCLKLIEQDDGHILLDDSLHGVKKEFFKSSSNNTLDNLVSNFIVRLLTKNRENMTIYYKDKKGILTFNVGNISIIGNEFLVKNSDYDFFLDINSKKNISLRANNRCDVSMMASKLFSGGGHANAAGGRFLEFKDTFIYSNAREQVEKKLDNS
jgi:oligoribonuclease NrnB/cAMP/cGMP phosphodiesterase (DHH superfamily)